MAVNYLGVRAAKKLIKEVFSFNLPFYSSYKRFRGYESLTCYNSCYDFTFVLKQYEIGNVWIHLTIYDTDDIVNSYVLHLMPDHKTFFYPDNYDSILSRIKCLI